MSLVAYLFDWRGLSAPLVGMLIIAVVWVCVFYPRNMD
jgi:hypothetical protein